MEKILNLSQIRAIFDGELEPIKEILLLLDETIPEFVEKVNKSILENDLVQFKFIIHKFKSSCQLVTNSFFIEYIKELEKSDYVDNNLLTQKVEKLLQYAHQLQKEIHETKLAA